MVERDLGEEIRINGSVLQGLSLYMYMAFKGICLPAQYPLSSTSTLPSGYPSDNMENSNHCLGE